MKLRLRHAPAHIVDQLVATGCDPALSQLYSARGIRSINEVQHELSQLLPTSDLHGIEAATELLYQALQHGKRLTVVADYDCDGATACAVALRGLARLSAAVSQVQAAASTSATVTIATVPPLEKKAATGSSHAPPLTGFTALNYFVPDRARHGYGLSPQIVELIHQTQAPDLIVTVDNGVASLEGVALANTLGMKVLITDHHLPANELPAAAALVNPNVPPCRFASKALAGVGVMFYVLLALRQRLRAANYFSTQNQPRLDDLLGLVALGTVADVVPLDINNRILVEQGLKRVRQAPINAGIYALAQIAGRDPIHLTVADLGYAIGPRINAAGRLEDMRLGIECLLTDDPVRAQQLAQQLDAINLNRREREQEMRTQALALLAQAEQGLETQRASICVFHPDWHPGIVGIVAGRLKERYHKPTLVFAPAQGSDDQTLRASGRSIAPLHLRDALDEVTKTHPHLIDKFGGHAMAAGLSLQKKHFAEFCQVFDAIVAKANLPPEQTWDCDPPLDIQAHESQFATCINQAVWGNGFAAPLFYRVFSVRQQRLLRDAHLKLTLEAEGQLFDAIWFGQSTTIAPIVGVLYRLDVNQYNGQSRLQLLIEHAASVDQIEWAPST